MFSFESKLLEVLFKSQNSNHKVKLNYRSKVWGQWERYTCNWKKIILLFSKDILNWSKVTVNKCLMLQISFISNNCCSFELSIQQRILKKMCFKTIDCWPEQQIIILEWVLKDHVQSRSSLYAEYTSCLGPPKHQGAPLLSKCFFIWIIFLFGQRLWKREW